MISSRWNIGKFYWANQHPSNNQNSGKLPPALFETLFYARIQGVGDGLAAQKTVRQWLTTLVQNRLAIVHHQHVQGSAEATINRKINGTVGRRRCHACRRTGAYESPPRDRCLCLGLRSGSQRQQQQGRDSERRSKNGHISNYPN